MANKYIANKRLTIAKTGEVIERGGEVPADLNLDFEKLQRQGLIVYGKSIRKPNQKRDSKRVQEPIENGSTDKDDSNGSE